MARSFGTKVAAWLSIFPLQLAAQLGYTRRVSTGPPVLSVALDMPSSEALMPLAAALCKSSDLAPDAVPLAETKEEDEEEQGEAGWAQ